jgi:hypothetical protein
MAAPKVNERREPVFDGASASDSGAEAPTPRRPKSSDGGNRPKRKRRSRKRGGGGGGRWTVGRVAYWSAVVSLWLVIATIGGAVWVGAHLPPIQSLDIGRTCLALPRGPLAGWQTSGLSHRSSRPQHRSRRRQWGPASPHLMEQDSPASLRRPARSKTPRRHHVAGEYPTEAASGKAVTWQAGEARS